MSVSIALRSAVIHREKQERSGKNPLLVPPDRSFRQSQHGGLPQSGTKIILWIKHNCIVRADYFSVYGWVVATGVNDPVLFSSAAII